jgi:hypothetical protein
MSMRAKRFAAILLSLSTPSSRRTMLAGLSGGGLTALAAAAPGDVVARKRHKRKKKRCCQADCAGKICGDDGCGGVCGVTCGEFLPYSTCCQGTCQYPTGEPGCCMAPGELCTPDGGATFGPKYCCSKSCDTGIGHTNQCQ